MANPKYKTARSKTRRRRANINLELPAITDCPQCHEKKRLHHLCSSCGFYNGREVISMEETKQKK